jgi:hypothetical protein
MLQANLLKYLLWLAWFFLNVKKYVLTTLCLVEANKFLSTNAIGITWKIKAEGLWWSEVLSNLHVVGIGRSQVFLGHPVQYLPWVLKNIRLLCGSE